MDLSKYELKDLILAALKSEIESRKIYLGLSENVKNFMLADRLKFLADEEKKHKDIFTKIFKDRFPGEKMEIPRQTPVPLPEIKMEEAKVPVSEVLQRAMAAEKAAHDFYTSMVALFSPDKGMQSMLTHIARMELGHYKILELEKESAVEIEDTDVVWPMIHIGP
jgi:rubrerythrin